MPLRIYQVDAFTRERYAGNPAGVCLLPGPRDKRWMQQVASEMNVSETAYLYAEEGSYRLRWFTPTVEVDLCGHATLASAHILWEEGHLRSGEPARFLTGSGLLTAERRDDWIELDFPAVPASAVVAPFDVAALLGAVPRFLGKNRLDFLAELESEDAVRRLRPDLSQMQQLPVRGFIVTARATTPGYDFVSRFFAPGAGVPEDPATGSAHCCLAPYWAERLDKSEMLGYQASARGGIIGVRIAGDRVILRGQAVTVLRGELLF